MPVGRTGDESTRPLQFFQGLSTASGEELPPSDSELATETEASEFNTENILNTRRFGPPAPENAGHQGSGHQGFGPSQVLFETHFEGLGLLSGRAHRDMPLSLNGERFLRDLETRLHFQDTLYRNGDLFDALPGERGYGLDTRYQFSIEQSTHEIKDLRSKSPAEVRGLLEMSSRLLTQLESGNPELESSTLTQEQRSALRALLELMRAHDAQSPLHVLGHIQEQLLEQESLNEFKESAQQKPRELLESLDTLQAAVTAFQAEYGADPDQNERSFAHFFAQEMAQLDMPTEMHRAMLNRFQNGVTPDGAQRILDDLNGRTRRLAREALRLEERTGQELQGMGQQSLALQTERTQLESQLEMVQEQLRRSDMPPDERSALVSQQTELQDRIEVLGNQQLALSSVLTETNEDLLDGQAQIHLRQSLTTDEAFRSRKNFNDGLLNGFNAIMLRPENQMGQAARIYEDMLSYGDTELTQQNLAKIEREKLTQGLNFAAVKLMTEPDLGRYTEALKALEMSLTENGRLSDAHQQSLQELGLLVEDGQVRNHFDPDAAIGSEQIAALRQISALLGEVRSQSDAPELQASLQSLTQGRHVSQTEVRALRSGSETLVSLRDNLAILSQMEAELEAERTRLDELTEANNEDIAENEAQQDQVEQEMQGLNAEKSQMEELLGLSAQAGNLGQAVAQYPAILWELDIECRDGRWFQAGQEIDALTVERQIHAAAEAQVTRIDGKLNQLEGDLSRLQDSQSTLQENGLRLQAQIDRVEAKQAAYEDQLAVVRGNLEAARALANDPERFQALSPEEQAELLRLISAAEGAVARSVDVLARSEESVAEAERSVDKAEQVVARCADLLARGRKLADEMNERLEALSQQLQQQAQRLEASASEAQANEAVQALSRLSAQLSQVPQDAADGVLDSLQQIERVFRKLLTQQASARHLMAQSTQGFIQQALERNRYQQEQLGELSPNAEARAEALQAIISAQQYDLRSLQGL